MADTKIPEMLKLNEEHKFGELIKFPANVKFKFIGVNDPNLIHVVRSFFHDDLKLIVNATEGALSRTGKYRTIEAQAEVPTEDFMYRIYNEGAKLPHVLKVL